MRSTTERGYGGTHQAERARWQPTIDTGHARCAQPICLYPTRTIHPWQRWDLGHTADRTTYIGPCHTRCNRADGGRRSHQHRHRRTPPPTW